MVSDDCQVTPPPGKGVRRLKLMDQAPDCEIRINAGAYELEQLVAGKAVVDIGCGHGRTRAVVESLGGTWCGVEPFEGGAHTVTASAECLPFDDASYDVVIMNAVLEHIPDVSAAFSEVGRILKPGGVFVGYVAFMENFHEISYSHLSFKALEHFAKINGMTLEIVSGGSRFGFDYHLSTLLYPLPFGMFRSWIAASVRGMIRLKSVLAHWVLRYRRRMSAKEARDMANLYYQVECLRYSQGFNFVIRRDY